VACVVFDEFHERSLNADLGLALCIESQQTCARSAPHRHVGDSGLVAARAAVERRTHHHCDGRSFDVATHYVPRRDDIHLELQTAQVVRRALEDHVGDIFAFCRALPKSAVYRGLGRSELVPGVRVLPLYASSRAPRRTRRSARARR